MADDPMRLKIFVSSPGDVGQERRIAEKVIERLDAEFGEAASLDPYFWEYEPFVITGDYQEQIPPPSAFDIFICILWSRLGSRLSAKYTLPPDHLRAASSGTEYEFVDAKLAYDKSKSPEILVWVNQSKLTIDADDPQFEELKNQRDALKAFIESWTRDSTDQTFSGAINRYANREEFEEMLEMKLRKVVLNRLGERATALRSHPRWPGNPYRGLAVFEYRHAPVFFGRTAPISESVDRLRERLHLVWREQEEAARLAEIGALATPGTMGEDATIPDDSLDTTPRTFLLILGASGSGKSSLVRAGILPMLAESGAIEGVGQWRCAVLKPSDGGGNLMLALSSALVRSAETQEALHDDDLPHTLTKAVLQPAALPELLGDGETAATLAVRFSKQPESAADRVAGAVAQAAALLVEREKTHLTAAIQRDQKSGREEDAAALSRRLADFQPKRVCLALVIDQLEELFTGDYTAGQIETFLLALDALAAGGRAAVIGTLRSDFFAECEGRKPHQQLLMHLKSGSGTLHLPPPQTHELGQMIRLPAQAAGVRFEETPDLGKLEDRIRDAALRDPDSLPILQFCLEKLYATGSDDGVLGHSEYGIDEATPGIGQLEGVLSRHAEETFARLEPDQQETLHRVILSLATLGDSVEPVSAASGGVVGSAAPQLVRRHVAYDTLTRKGSGNAGTTPPERALVDAFIEARLFTSNRNEEGLRTVSVTHEALLKRWDRAAVWLGLDENQRFLRIQKQVARKLALWKANGEDGSFLLQPGRELSDADEQFREHPEGFERGEGDFILRSFSSARAREQSRVRTRNRVIGVLAVLMLVAVGAAGWAVVKQAAESEAKHKRDQMLQFVLRDLRAELEKSGTLAATGLALTKLDSVLDTSPDYGEKLFAQSVAVERARILFLTNKRKEALAMLEHLISEQDSDTTGVISDDILGKTVRARTHAVAGDLYAWDRTNLAAAEASCQKSISVYEQLLLSCPASEKIQQSLSEVRIYLGDAMRERGNREGALGEFRKALAILEKLPADLDSLGRDGLTAKAARRAGEILFGGDNYHEAELEYRRALATADAGSAANQSDRAWKECRGITWNRLGDVAQALGNKSVASSLYEQSRQTLTELILLDPDNALLNWEAVVASHKSSDFKAKSEAIKSLNEARKLNEELLTVDPENSEWIDGMSTIWFKLARAESGRNPNSALEMLDRSLALVDRSNSTVESLQRSSFRFVLIGQIHNRKGEHAEAVAKLEAERSALMSRLPGMKGNDLEELQEAIALLDEPLVDALVKLDRLEDATEIIKSVLSYRATIRSPTQEDRVSLVNAYQRLATVQRERLQFESVRETFQAAFGVVDSLQNSDAAAGAFEDLRGDLHLSRGSAFIERDEASAMADFDAAILHISEALRSKRYGTTSEAQCIRRLSFIHSKRATLLESQREFERADTARAHMVAGFMDFLFASEIPLPEDLNILVERLARDWYSTDRKPSQPIEGYRRRAIVAQDLRRLAKLKGLAMNDSGQAEQLAQLLIRAAEALLHSVEFALENAIEIPRPHLDMDLAHADNLIKSVKSAVQGNVSPLTMQTISKLNERIKATRLELRENVRG